MEKLVRVGDPQFTYVLGCNRVMLRKIEGVTGTHLVVRSFRWDRQSWGQSSGDVGLEWFHTQDGAFWRLLETCAVTQTFRVIQEETPALTSVVNLRSLKVRKLVYL